MVEAQHSADGTRKWLLKTADGHEYEMVFIPDADRDDISDGPVTAEVVYEGVSLKVDPAWVICAPPDYAPMQKSVRTMWDLMRSVAVKSGMLTRSVLFLLKF